MSSSVSKPSSDMENRSKSCCSVCGEAIGFPENFIASKLFPAKCNSCGASNYRRHIVSSSLSFIVTSIGLLAIIFVVMMNGFAYAFNVIIVCIVIISASYFIEVMMFPLYEFTKEAKEKNIKISKNRSWIFSAVIIISLICYYLSESL